jgi:hypothetical protein
MRSLLGYLVLDQPRQRYTHWVEALAPLGAPGSPPPLQVDAYFVAAEDRALLALWYLAGDVEATALVAEVTRLAEIYVIDPACLADPDRRVLQDRLAECEVIVDRRTSIADALGELVKRVRELRVTPVLSGASSRTITGRPLMAAVGPLARDSSSVLAAANDPAVREEWSERDRIERAERAERAETQDWQSRQQAEREASGLRNLRELRDVRDPRDGLDDSPRLGRPAGTRNDIAPLTPSAPLLPRARRPSQASPLGSSIASRPMPPRMPPVMPPLTARIPPLVGSGHSSHSSHSGGASASAAGGDGLVAATSATSARPAVHRERRARTEATTDPFLLAFDAAAPSFSAHYLRGQRWLPALLSHLSIEGAQLAVVSLPRLGDTAYLALAFGDFEVAVRAEVSHVSDEVEAQTGGAAFFQVKFALDDVVREKLYTLLLRARQAKAQLLPPPPRASRRSAVVWPLMLATPRGSIRAELVDLSERGLFVAPLRELELAGNIGFSLVIDDHVTSVSGRAEVVRRLEAAEAKARGLRPGYGLELTDLAGSHRQPWERFVARVRRRAARRVLVGAPATRFDELAAGLLAAGYAVHGAVEPASLAQLAEAERRPPDAAVLDAEWMAAGGQAAWMEALLTARGIRCLTSHGDPRRAYGELDRLLGLG